MELSSGLQDEPEALELESDLLLDIKSDEDSSSSYGSALCLRDLLDDIKNEESSVDFDIAGLPGFGLLDQSKRAIDLTRLDTLALVQDIKDVLTEGGAKKEPEDSQYIVDEGDHLNAGEGIPSCEANLGEDYTIVGFADSGESLESCDSRCNSIDRDGGNYDLDDSGHAPSDLDVLVDAAAKQASENARIIEERHRLRQLKLCRREDMIRFKRYARIIQEWFRRRISIKKAFFSTVQNVSCIEVKHILEIALCRCASRPTIHYCQGLNDLFGVLPVVANAATESYRQTSHSWQLFLDSDYNNCQYIIVERDAEGWRVHIFAPRRRKILHFTVYLSKKEARESIPLLPNSSVYVNPKIQPTVVLFGATQCCLQSLYTCFSISLKKEESINLWTSTNPIIETTSKERSLPLMTRASIACNINRKSITRKILLATLDSDQPRVIAIVQQGLVKLNNLIQRFLARSMFVALRRRKAAIDIQSRYRGFVVRRRLESIKRITFDYEDMELDSILCDDISHLMCFGESEDDYVHWNPRKPRTHSLSQHSQCVNVDSSVKYDSENKTSVSLGDISSQNIKNNGGEMNESSQNETSGPRPEKWKIKDSRVAQAIAQRKWHMKRKGSNGIALRLRR